MAGHTAKLRILRAKAAHSSPFPNGYAAKPGFCAPAVLASDLRSGLYLVEDLGDAVFGQLIAESAPLEPLYALAVDGLLAVRASKPPRDLPLSSGVTYRVPDYDREALEVELDLLFDRDSKLQTGELASPELAASFFEAWSPFLDWLDAQPKELVLRDFHSPNLLLCETRSGLRRLGAIDFQDALWGHPAYDSVSLLQDARLEVPAESERALFERYCNGAAKADPSFGRGAFAESLRHPRRAAEHQDRLYFRAPLPARRQAWLSCTFATHRALSVPQSRTPRYQTAQRMV